MGSYRSLVTSVALLTLLAAACGDDAPPSMPDASTGDAGSDSGIVDTTAPTVTGSQPADGDRNVPESAPIVLEFSEPMDPSVGTVTVSPGDITLTALDGSYTDGDTRKMFIGAVPFEPGTEYELVVQTDFADKAGNPLANDFRFSFTVLDDTRPTVVASGPTEGELAVDPATETLTVTFSESMDPAVGTAVLSGGLTTLGDPTWNVDNTGVVYPIVDLESDTRYAVSFEEFADDSGNRLDSAPYLIDGFLDFETGGDMTLPVVLTDPVEAATGVDPILDELTITFSETMNSTVRQVELSDGTTTTVLTGIWSPDRTSIRFDIDELLAFDTDYTVELTRFAYTDLSGNVLDTTSYLGDGFIDFSTSGAATGPIVLAADPGEGSTSVDFNITPLVVQFNSAMNTAITDAQLCNMATCTTLVGTWTAADTTIEFAIPPLTFVPAKDYTIDLTGFQDAGGLPLNPRPYLDDGLLDFSMLPPTGDTCLDPLTVDVATGSGGSLSWIIPDEPRRDNGATDSCDPDASGASQDIVARYDKTTADLAGGGTLLRIAINAGTDDVNVQVQRDVCDPRAATPLTCQHDFGQRDVFLDVGPGTYYIWIAQDTTGNFGGSLSVEELSGWPVGESCAAPYTTAAPEYMAPAMAGAPHIWELDGDNANGHDRTLFTDDGSVSCNSSPAGGDTVVQYDKATDASLLQVTVTPTDTSFSVSDLDIEISSECDPADSSNEVYACRADLGTGSFTTFVTAPAGPLFVWLMNNDTDDPFPGARVEVLEVPVADGESCSAGRALTGAGPHTLVLDSTEALGSPSCFGAGDVTWFAYTPSDNLTTVTPNAGGNIALVDQGTNAELVCSSDGTGGLTRIIAAGETVCIAVENGAAITTLSFSEAPYTGVLGQVTDLNVGRALTSTGSEVSWTGDTWMAHDAGTLYMADCCGVFLIPRAGGGRATEFDADEGVSSSQPGDCGLVTNGSLFSVDDTSSSSSSRWYRLWDGVQFPWAPVAWDTAVYDSEDIFGCNTEGGDLFAVQDTNTTSIPDTVVYSLSATTMGAPTRLGTNSALEDIVGIAVDDEYFYFAGEADVPTVGLVDGVFRMLRSDITNTAAVPEVLATVTSMPSFNQVKIALDDLVDPQHLYFRYNGEIHVVLDPDGASPAHLGAISPVGRSGDYAMTFDPVENAIFMFETEGNSLGRIVRLD